MNKKITEQEFDAGCYKVDRNIQTNSDINQINVFDVFEMLRKELFGSNSLT